MKSKWKRLIELIVCIAVIAVTAGIGIVTGFMNDIKPVHFDLKMLGQLLVMIVLVIACEKLIISILALFKGSTHRSSTLLTIFCSLTRYVTALVVICWGLTIMGVNVTTIAASVGIVALVVGFGAESLIEDVITGIFMLFENQYNVGDIIEINGFRGTVSSVGIRTTSVTDVGGNVKIINNANMKDILNRSNQISKAVSEIDVAYSTDIEALEQQLPEMLEKIYALHKDVMMSAPEYLGVAVLGASGVTLKFCVEVDEKNIYSTQRILNRELLVFFHKMNVNIPFPQVEIHQSQG